MMNTNSSNLSGAGHTNLMAESPSGRGTTVGSMTSLSRALRFLGALLVVASTSTFMLQQWNAGGSTRRYLTLLAMTVILVAAGVFCGARVRESRGARTFFALVVAAVPIHFAVLGGLLQSQLPWDHFVGENAPWHADSVTTALWLTGAGIAVLIPCIYLSMLTLVRPSAGKVTRAYIAANLVLLVPVRNPDLVVWLIAASFMLVTFFEHRVSTMGPTLRTGEGVYVRALLLAPAAILVGRTVLWYEPTYAFTGLVLLVTGCACFAWLRTIRHRATFASYLQFVSSIGAVTGSFVLGVAILDAGAIPAQLEIPLLTLPAAGLLLFLSRLSVSTGTGYRAAAALLAVSLSATNMFLYWDPTHLSMSGFVCLFVGVLFVGIGIHGKRFLPLFLGVIGVAVATTHFVVASIEVENLLHWGTLAAVGMILIFIAAIFERYAQRIVALAGTFEERLREWDY